MFVIWARKRTKKWTFTHSRIEFWTFVKNWHKVCDGFSQNVKCLCYARQSISTIDLIWINVLERLNYKRLVAHTKCASTMKIHHNIASFNSCTYMTCTSCIKKNRCKTFPSILADMTTICESLSVHLICSKSIPMAVKCAVSYKIGICQRYDEWLLNDYLSQ